MSRPHLSPAMRLDGALHVSGQLPFTSEGTLPDGITAQTHQVISNLEAVLQAEGLALDNVVKAGVFLVKSEDFGAFSEVYAARFGTHRPARSTVVAGLVAPGALVEIDAIARIPIERK